MAKTRAGNSIRWGNKARDQKAHLLGQKPVKGSPVVSVPRQSVAQKPKRKPLLVDEFMSANLVKWPDKQEERTFVAVREHMREAKKFVLDDAAARYAAEFIRDHPEAIAYDQDFAIPPFPRMYIELPYPEFFSILGGTNVHDPVYGDTEVGYFIDGPSVYVLSRVRGGLDNDAMRRVLGATSMIMPIRYRLNQPFTVKEEIEVCERMDISRLTLDFLYWGSSLKMNWHGRNLTTEALSRSAQLEAELRNADETDKIEVPPYGRALRANHSFEQWYARDMPDLMMRTFKSAAGDLRNIIALILFLNRTNDVRFDEQMPHKQGWIGPKPALLMKHNIVRMRLDPKPSLIKTYGSSGAWRRRHEVRGHFCHDKTARANKHHLIPQPVEVTGHQPDWREYDVNQWRCLICGGKRWHRKAHARGHEEKGCVLTTYEVTK